jgi:hypothetical protein
MESVIYIYYLPILHWHHMNLRLELENWPRQYIALLVGALHRNRRAAGWIPARGPI